MMYIIVSPSAVGRAPEKFVWLLGEKKPEIQGQPVLWVQADSKELAEILTKFRGVPFKPETYSMVWRAPWAQFIYDNL
jgi:hypothetical protein